MFGHLWKVKALLRWVQWQARSRRTKKFIMLFNISPAWGLASQRCRRRGGSVQIPTWGVAVWSWPLVALSRLTALHVGGEKELPSFWINSARKRGASEALNGNRSHLDWWVYVWNSLTGNVSVSSHAMLRLFRALVPPRTNSINPFRQLWRRSRMAKNVLCWAISTPRLAVAMVELTLGRRYVVRRMDLAPWIPLVGKVWTSSLSIVQLFVTPGLGKEIFTSAPGDILDQVNGNVLTILLLRSPIGACVWIRKFFGRQSVILTTTYCARGLLFGRGFITFHEPVSTDAASMSPNFPRGKMAEICRRSRCFSRRSGRGLRWAVLRGGRLSVCIWVMQYYA